MKISIDLSLYDIVYIKWEKGKVSGIKDFKDKEKVMEEYNRLSDEGFKVCILDKDNNILLRNK